jgi:hypothetical protein
MLRASRGRVQLLINLERSMTKWCLQVAKAPEILKHERSVQSASDAGCRQHEFEKVLEVRWRVSFAYPNIACRLRANLLVGACSS